MTDEELQQLHERWRDTPQWVHVWNASNGDHIQTFPTHHPVAVRLTIDDAEAIINARLDVAALLAEVEQLRKALHDIAIEAEAGARHNEEMGDGFLLYVATKFAAIRQIIDLTLEPEKQ